MNHHRPHLVDQDMSLVNKWFRADALPRSCGQLCIASVGPEIGAAPEVGSTAIILPTQNDEEPKSC
jgi:hypothetical protein